MKRPTIGCMFIDVSPVTSIHQPLPIVISEVDPGARVEISFEAVDAHGESFTAVEGFTASTEGVVSTDVTLPESAHWTPADSLGPLWTMSPGKGHNRPFAFSASSPMLIQLKVRTPGEGQATKVQRVVARGIVEVPVSTRYTDPKADDYARIKGSADIFSSSHPVDEIVDTGSFAARAYADDADGLLPAVVVFDDFTGGCPSAAAAALADLGFLAVAVDVLSASGGRTPVDGHALEVLLEAVASHGKVDDSVHLGLVGRGRGAELALMLAAARPDLVGPVVAHSPSDVVTASPRDGGEVTFTGIDGASDHLDPKKAGKKLSWSTFTKAALTGKPWYLKPWYEAVREAHPDEAVVKASIPVDRCRGPLLVTAPTDDRVWDSVGMARHLQQRASKADVETYVCEYPGAGHGVGFPFTFAGAPVTPVVVGYGHTVELGGDRIATGRAARESTEQVVSFLSSAFGIGDYA
ncbi:acyl-CoA thioester hydrolase/BAAT C-terminal domain-containing protein [Corynebacterium mendelii]|uniref:Acyl-CoA thioesterase/BAAT N-terminal domain-containing protein n=1 Tax=Corynebacterium mendelii TaxID=2765362 RepID=A0A939DZM1_9CORY|nr:acyl-CoA thioester hydrolase/BAAT C-terminal domain-containing protein [Corynebacterium mendelii]MBN9643036.1 acyl-CoA thioesterase/BAAT N-terminal domain-containing protein [Corynebacterium mendelii]